jgi:hypothetical protein
MTALSLGAETGRVLAGRCLSAEEIDGLRGAGIV